MQRLNLERGYEDVVIWKRMRYLMAFMLTLATSIAYSLRATLSIAIVAMTNNSTDADNPAFEWDSSVQGTVLSAFFWGCIAGNILSALLINHYSARWLLLLGMALSTLGTYLTPVVSTAGDWPALSALRVLEGLSQGPVFPAAFSILAKWAIPAERGTLGSLCVSGMLIGSMISLPVSGELASSYGWPSIFYTFGSIGLVWCILWLLLGYDTPQEHPFVSEEEKQFIISFGNDTKRGDLSTPYLEMAKSLPVWAIIICQCVHAFGFYVMLTEIPTYMNNILHYDIRSNGLLNALPYIATQVFIFIFGWLSRLLIEKQFCRIGVARNIFNTIGSFGPALATCGLTFVGAKEKELAVGLLVLASGFGAGTFLGFQVNHLDLSPNFSGVTIGIANSLSNVVSALVPLLVAAIVTDVKSEDQWHTVFWVSAGLDAIGAVAFLVLSSAEVQPWNHGNETTKNTSIEKKSVREMGHGWSG